MGNVFVNVIQVIQLMVILWVKRGIRLCPKFLFKNFENFKLFVMYRVLLTLLFHVILCIHFIRMFY